MHFNFTQNKRVHLEWPLEKKKKKKEITGESACLRARRLTLAFMVDIPRSNDFVEDSRERLILSYDSGRDERRHDELPLADVGFHGYPGGDISEWERKKSELPPSPTGDRQMDGRAAQTTRGSTFGIYLHGNKTETLNTSNKWLSKECNKNHNY